MDIISIKVVFSVASEGCAKEVCLHEEHQKKEPKRRNRRHVVSAKNEKCGSWNGISTTLISAFARPPKFIRNTELPTRVIPQLPRHGKYVAGNKIRTANTELEKPRR